MQISPVREESALLYAESGENVPITHDYELTPIQPIQPIQPTQLLVCVVAEPSTMPLYGIAQWSASLVSLLAIILLLANRFELLRKNKKKVLDEKEKIRYDKHRKIFLSLLIISNIIFCCSGIGNLIYQGYDENSEIIVCFVILLCYIFAIIKNIIKIKKCEIEKKAKYLNRLEIISILLIPVTLIVTFLYELVI